MKYTFVLGLFLGSITKEAVALRLEKHGRHHQQQRDDAWIDDCYPGRNPYIAGNGNAGVNAPAPVGVGVECQGFGQRKAHSLAQDDAWIDDCYPGRNPYIAGNGNAGVNAAAAGVGVECQGFAQRKAHSLAQDDAWIDDCYPGRNPYIAGNGNAGVNAAAAGVGVECQGFAQRKSHSLAQDDAWIDDCNPNRNPFVPGNPDGAGTYEKAFNGNYGPANVGVDCQGFAQRKHHSLAQQRDDAWIDDCDPTRNPFVPGNPSGAGTYEDANKGTYGPQKPGIECQGFAQKKSIQHLAQLQGGSQQKDDAWIDDCYPGRNPYIAGNGNAGVNAAAAGVGVECQGFAQRKSHSLAQDDAWIDDCYPGRNPYIAGNGNAGVNAPAATGVGVECQGFGQKKANSLAQQKDDAWIDDCYPGRNPYIAGNGNAGVNAPAATGVGVECQGFAQLSNQGKRQIRRRDYNR